MSRTALSPAYRALSRRALRESIPRPVRPSDRRRMRHAADSSPDDVPTPEEIDPGLLNCSDCANGCRDCVGAFCDGRGYLDVFGAVRAM